MKLIYCALVVCLLLVPCALAQGVGQAKNATQDVVTFGPSTANQVDPWTAKNRTTISGSIQQFDSESLILIQPDGAKAEISSGRIERVSIAWETEEARSAIELLKTRQYREAAAALSAARQGGVPVWQQRFLVAGIVRAANALKSPKSAGVLFLNLAATSPPPLLYSEMPLCWMICEPNPAHQEQARQWLADEREAAQLMGASWLLFGQESERARRVLLELRAAKSPVIAQLAIAQGWRLIPPPLTRTKLQSWLTFRDGLIEPLQVGPTEFIADRLGRIGDVDLAIGQWMRIASLHSDRYDRASSALKAARRLLERNGRNDEANRLTSWIEQSTKP